VFKGFGRLRDNERISSAVVSNRWAVNEAGRGRAVINTGERPKSRGIRIPSRSHAPPILRDRGSRWNGVMTGEPLRLALPRSDLRCSCRSCKLHCLMHTAMCSFPCIHNATPVFFTFFFVCWRRVANQLHASLKSLSGYQNHDSKLSCVLQKKS
jgi:hypothetical protein